MDDYKLSINSLNGSTEVTCRVLNLTSTPNHDIETL